ncbi:recombinase family protein [Terasakiella sp. A23]|uniref:recombinase family protein n=1 Tax=Terasakiella sp. FCG-A23 TaxID=3080561 RepID=UPI0029543B94|nr:recombinase family protein [Terasakiella sp. A23]MDV7341349.1 recombinase family protein [Terasakiella sp. A23]
MTNLNLGYARVSGPNQNLDLQIKALEDAGCDKIITEKASSMGHRPKFEEMLSVLRKGDIVTVWKLDRLGRKSLQLHQTIDEIHQKGAYFRCITQDMDTSTSQGMLLFTMLSAVAEMELNNIRERTRAGLERARAKGNFGGRRKSLTDIQERKLFHEYTDPERVKTTKEIAEYYGISRQSVVRIVNRISKQVADEEREARANLASKNNLPEQSDLEDFTGDHVHPAMKAS